MKARPIEVTLARFHSSYIPEPESGCWIWTRHCNKFGYAYFNVGRKHYRAHRWIWEQLHGPIPKALQCDHLCRVRCCVNPDHIRLVTSRENTLAGISPPAINIRKTHCLNGHPFSPENILETRGYRECRICRNARWLRCHKNRKRRRKK